MIRHHIVWKTAACCLASLCFACLPIRTAADDWLQWRGPDREDRSAETGLLQEWPDEGPKQLWVNESCGLGYAGCSVQGKRLFTLGLEENAEFALCLDAETGEELWRQNIGPRFQNAWGDGPRSTPTIDGKFVYFLSAAGELACLEGNSGQIRWSKNLADFGGRVPVWGYAESPLVDGDQIVCTPGGNQGAILALNKRNGKKLWQTSSLTPRAHYSSLIAVDWGGRRQYIQQLVNAIVGIDAKTGDVLWQSERTGRTAVIPTPIFSKGIVYVTAGYKVGSKAVELDDDNNVHDLWETISMQNHHGGVIRVDEHVYGYSDRDGWCCQNLMTGKLAWKHSKRKITKGAITWADNRFYHLQERDGQVVLIEATPDGLVEHGRFTLSPLSEQRSPRGKIWVHPVIANGRLYLRDQEYLHCYDVSR